MNADGGPQTRLKCLAKSGRPDAIVANGDDECGSRGGAGSDSPGQDRCARYRMRRIRAVGVEDNLIEPRHCGCYIENHATVAAATPNDQFFQSCAPPELAAEPINSGTVAWPARLIPLRPNTEAAVIQSV